MAKKNKTNRVRKIHLKKKAPPKAAYMKVFDMIEKGAAAGPKGIKGIGKGAKIRRMVWIVSEATMQSLVSATDSAELEMHSY